MIVSEVGKHTAKLTAIPQKCDIEYSKELHDAHNDYPLAPERKLVTQQMLSPYALEMQKELCIGKDATTEKLVPNLQDKKDYVVDIRNLKFYRDHGLKQAYRNLKRG